MDMITTPSSKQNYVLLCFVLCYVVYCIVLHSIVLYCIVLCCVVLYCIALYCIGDKDHAYALLMNQMILPFHFCSTMFVQTSFNFFIAAISLSYDICSVFHN